MTLPAKTPDDYSFAAELADAAVLVIDDEPGMRNFLSKTLSTRCARVDVAADTRQATDLLDRNAYDVIVLDNVMPGTSGVEWLAEQQRIGLFSDAILMTAYADLDTAIAALRAGASDFLMKPFRANQILNALSKSVARASLRRQNSVLQNELETGPDLLRHRDALLGGSAEIEATRGAIERAAATPAHVVIRGETGSGKQIAARMLHGRSPRAGHPFLWVQCFGLDAESFQLRLFGRLGAEAPDPSSAAGREGILLNATGGTLFMEDVEVLSSACQNLLVELLTAGRFQPVGASRSVPLNVRIICSSTRPLSDAVEAGTFRTDLYYLLNVVEIVLPPLRERTEDILHLAEFFSENLSQRMGIAPLELTPAVRRRLLAHDWPGNVMELRNTVERGLIHGDFETALASAPGSDTAESLASVEQRHILAVLEACGGNRAEAARKLGVARKTIDRKCAAWGL
ncbi:MAG: sigma-54 dependent transcriptional regulator [Pseudomonadota bacterium]